MPDNSHPKSQLGRVVIPGDKTVVQKQNFTNKYGTDELIQRYLDHTRVIHHTAETYALWHTRLPKLLHAGFYIKQASNRSTARLISFCENIVMGMMTVEPVTTIRFSHHILSISVQEGTRDITAISMSSRLLQQSTNIHTSD
jgi:hypothetical protein